MGEKTAFPNDEERENKQNIKFISGLSARKEGAGRTKKLTNR